MANNAVVFLSALRNTPHILMTRFGVAQMNDLFQASDDEDVSKFVRRALAQRHVRERTPATAAEYYSRPSKTTTRRPRSPASPLRHPARRAMHLSTPPHLVPVIYDTRQKEQTHTQFSETRRRLDDRPLLIFLVIPGDSCAGRSTTCCGHIWRVEPPCATGV